MTDKPLALVLLTAGTNCDAELVRALTLAGARVDHTHADRLIADPASIARYDIIAFPGGFSYGDDIASGRVLAVKVRERLWPALRDAAARGALMIGVCNGFQVMTQAGLLPDPMAPGAAPGEPPLDTVALADNAGARFIDRWLRIAPEPRSVCVWTVGLADMFAGDEAARDAAMRLPIAHGEGRFVAPPDVLRTLESRGQVALRYIDNDNGSQGAIAGICDPTGRIFGLRPHPERYLDWSRHPFWTRLPEGLRRGETPGMRIFRNAVAAARGVAAR